MRGSPCSGANWCRRPRRSRTRDSRVLLHLLPQPLLAQRDERTHIAHRYAYLRPSIGIFTSTRNLLWHSTYVDALYRSMASGAPFTLAARRWKERSEQKKG